MENIGLKKLLGRGKTPDHMILDVEVVSKICPNTFKITDTTIENLVDLEVTTKNEQVFKYLEEGNKIRLLFVEFRRPKVIVTEKTQIFLLSMAQVC